MKKIIVTIAMLLALTGCTNDKDYGGSSGGSGELNLPCLPVAGVRGFTGSFYPVGEGEHVDLAINADCTYVMTSETLGVLEGRIDPNSPRWQSTVATPGCLQGSLTFSLISRGVVIDSCHGEPYDQ